MGAWGVKSTDSDDAMDGQDSILQEIIDPTPAKLAAFLNRQASFLHWMMGQRLRSRNALVAFYA